MNELDEVWAQLTNQALENARTSGRGDVAEYFQLKANNDEIRAASVGWLLDSASEIAQFVNQNKARVTIEKENSHRFLFKNANLVGSCVRIRQGVRCLTVEAGWTRTPTDGFMRGGALACARISHFGISKHNADLLLLKSDNVPNWFSVNDNGKKDIFDSRHLTLHFQVLLGEI